MKYIDHTITCFVNNLMIFYLTSLEMKKGNNAYFQMSTSVLQMCQLANTKHFPRTDKITCRKAGVTCAVTQRLTSGGCGHELFGMTLSQGSSDPPRGAPAMRGS